jgi:quercetin dioxygenase-like cupin family protein
MRIVKAEDVTPKPVEMQGARNAQIRMLIGPEHGAANFHMRMFSLEPQGQTPRHSHPWEHEMFFLSGHGVVETPQGPKPVAGGDCVFVPPGSEHQFRNTGSTTLKFLCLVPASQD